MCMLSLIAQIISVSFSSSPPMTSMAHTLMKRPTKLFKVTSHRPICLFCLPNPWDNSISTRCTKYKVKIILLIIFYCFAIFLPNFTIALNNKLRWWWWWLWYTNLCISHITDFTCVTVQINGMALSQLQLEITPVFTNACIQIGAQK